VPDALVFVAGAIDHGTLALPSPIDPLSLVPVALLRHQRAMPIALHSKKIELYNSSLIANKSKRNKNKE
jgi:hypothetical protein